MKTSIFNKLGHIFLHSFFLVCFTLVWHSIPAGAQTQNKTDQTPLHVVSDKMIAQKDASMVEFIGNVKVTRADSVVKADSIKIYFMEENKSNEDTGNIKKIISTGDVRYTAGEQQAFADKAVYTVENETLILTGDAPKLITGTSFVTGKKITLFRNEDKVLVESDGTKRVEAVFNPEDNIIEKQ